MIKGLQVKVFMEHGWKIDIIVMIKAPFQRDHPMGHDPIKWKGLGKLA